MLIRILSLSALLTVSASAAAVTIPPGDQEFAAFVQAGNAQQWTITGGSGTTTPTTVYASGQVSFTFEEIGTVFGYNSQLANFTLSAQTSTLGSCSVVGCGNGNSFSQYGYVGGFTITDAADGSNLLSGTFAIGSAGPSTSGAQLVSTGNNGASFDAGATAGNLAQLVMTSDYLYFPNTTTQEDAGFSLSSLIPGFAVGSITTTNGQSQADPASFRSTASAIFSSNPEPLIVGSPEPASLGLIGIGLIGLGMLRRRTKARRA